MIYPDPQRLPNEGIYYTPSGRALSVVDNMGGLVHYDELQHAIHKGEAFAFDAEGSIPANTSIYLMGITGAKEVHFDSFSGDFSQGNIRITLLEDGTTSANGTLQTPYRLNRVIPATNTLILYTAPTVLTDGNKMSGRFLPLSGGGANTAPRSGVIAGGRVLKPNTKYLFKITNTDANTANVYGINFTWYETTILLG